MTNQKGSIRTGLLIAVVVLVGALIYLVVARPGTSLTPTPTPTPTSPDETAGWKVYSNSKIGFEFKYPSNWTSKETYESRANYLNLQLSSAEMNTLLLVNSPGVGFENYSIQVSTGDLIVADTKATLLVMEESPEFVPIGDLSRGAFVQFRKDGNEYFFLFSYKKSGPDRLELAKETLSTFKFTSSDETAGGKTETPEEAIRTYFLDKRIISSNTNLRIRILGTAGTVVSVSPGNTGQGQGKITGYSAEAYFDSSSGPSGTVYQYFWNINVDAATKAVSADYKTTCTFKNIVSETKAIDAVFNNTGKKAAKAYLASSLCSWQVPSPLNDGNYSVLDSGEVSFLPFPSVQ